MNGSAGKVVVQAAMSLDGFIAGPGDSMDWVFEYTTPDEFPEIVRQTGAMLSGRRSYDVGQRLGAGRHFYSSAAGRRVDLEPVRCSRSGSVHLLQFNVRKQDGG